MLRPRILVAIVGDAPTVAGRLAVAIGTRTASAARAPSGALASLQDATAMARVVGDAAALGRLVAP